MLYVKMLGSGWILLQLFDVVWQQCNWVPRS